jgi:hypothetical protein
MCVFNKKRTWYFLFDFTGGKSQFAGGGSLTLNFCLLPFWLHLSEKHKIMFVCVEELEVKYGVGWDWAGGSRQFKFKYNWARRHE